MNSQKKTFWFKSAMAAIFLLMFLFGFNAAGMLINVFNPNYFIPMFTMGSRESPNIGLLRRMHSIEPSYAENYSKLFVESTAILPISSKISSTRPLH